MKKILAITLCLSLFGMGLSGCATLPTSWDALVEKLCPHYLQYRDGIMESKNILVKAAELIKSVPVLADEPILVAGLAVIISGITAIIDLAEQKCLSETDVAEAQAIAKSTMQNNAVKLAMARAKQLGAKVK